MILGAQWNEIAWLVLAILIGGVITGILAGLFGIGGGGHHPGALRIVSHPRRVRRCAHRHFDCHYRADVNTFIFDAS